MALDVNFDILPFIKFRSTGKKWNKYNQKMWLILVYYDVRKYFDKLSPSEIQRNWRILCLEFVKKRLCRILWCRGLCLVVRSVEWIIPTWSFLSDLCNIVLSTLQWLPAKPGGNHRLVLLWETGRCDLPVQSPHYCRINSLIVNWSTYWVVREREREKERARLVVSSRVTRA